MWVNEDTPGNHINMYFKQKIIARGLHETADKPFQTGMKNEPTEDNILLVCHGSF